MIVALKLQKESRMKNFLPANPTVVKGILYKKLKISVRKRSFFVRLRSNGFLKKGLNLY